MSNAPMPDNALKEVSINHHWKPLLAIGGLAALVAAVLFRRWLGAEVGLFQSIGTFGLGPYTEPAMVSDWYSLLQAHKLIGLALLNGLDLINYALVGLMIIGIYAALQKVSRALMTLASILAAVGIAEYFVSNQAFTLLSLSHQYASATTDAQRALLVSAGQALLAINDSNVFGTGTFWGFIFVSLSCLIISIIMLKSVIFSRWTAIIGIIANALGLGYFFTAAIYPPLTAIPLSGSAPFLLIWYILIGIKLLKLSRSGKKLNESEHLESVAPKG